MSLKFKGSIKEFKNYIEAMQLVFGKGIKVNDVLRKINA